MRIEPWIGSALSVPIARRWVVLGDQCSSADRAHRFGPVGTKATQFEHPTEGLGGVVKKDGEL